MNKEDFINLIKNTNMKTFLVTFYFTNGEVHAIRYEGTNVSSIEEIAKKVATNKFISSHDLKDVINMKQVCRFTVDEIEGDE